MAYVKPESVLENKMHKILWDFKIQTNHPILARRLDLVSIDKNLSMSGFCCHSSRPESKSKN